MDPVVSWCLLQAYHVWLFLKRARATGELQAGEDSSINMTPIKSQYQNKQFGIDREDLPSF